MRGGGRGGLAESKEEGLLKVSTTGIGEGRGVGYDDYLVIDNKVMNIRMFNPQYPSLVTSKNYRILI